MPSRQLGHHFPLKLPQRPVNTFPPLLKSLVLRLQLKLCQIFILKQHLHIFWSCFMENPPLHEMISSPFFQTIWRRWPTSAIAAFGQSLLFPCNLGPHWLNTKQAFWYKTAIPKIPQLISEPIISSSCTSTSWRWRQEKAGKVGHVRAVFRVRSWTRRAAHGGKEARNSWRPSKHFL